MVNAQEADEADGSCCNKMIPALQACLRQIR